VVGGREVFEDDHFIFRDHARQQARHRKLETLTPYTKQEGGGVCGGCGTTKPPNNQPHIAQQKKNALTADDSKHSGGST